jgi:tetratricopeptide (TPR) repeat protein
MGPEMLNRTLRAAFVALALVGLAASPLLAAGEGRIMGSIVDSTNAPVVGAKVTLTRPGTSYKLEKVSDAKGQFMLLILDATQEYVLKIEKEGFAPYEGPVKPKLEEAMRLQFTLDKPSVQAAPAAASPAAQAIDAYNQGVASLKAQDLPAAIAKFQESNTLDPKLPEPHAALAELYLEQKKYAEALASADAFLALKPDDPRGLKSRYDALVGLGEKEKASAVLETLAKVDTGSDTAVRVINEGVALFNANKAAEAIPVFEKALALDPKLAKAHYLLGLSYANTGDMAKAKTHLEAFVAMAPEDKDAATAKEMLASMK